MIYISTAVKNDLKLLNMECWCVYFIIGQSILLTLQDIEVNWITW